MIKQGGSFNKLYGIKIDTFSIITVVKNDLSGLIETEASIKKQLHVSYEWIVIDGDSVDGTKDYLASGKCVATKYVSEKDSGIYAAMNKGILASEGDFILFLNAGDIFPASDTLEKISARLAEVGKSVDVVFCGALLRFSDGSTWYRATRQLRENIWHGLPANHQATYIRRTVLNNFAYPNDYRICGDYYLAAILSQKNVRALYIDEPAVCFRIGDISYKKPWLLIKEAYKIQRDVLHIGRVMRLLSAFRRTFAIAGTIAIETKSKLKRMLIRKNMTRYFVNDK